MVRFVWLVALAGCFTPKQTPCAYSSISTDLRRTVTGTVQIAHGAIVERYELPDHDRRLGLGGGGYPIKGLEGEMKFLVGGGFHAKTANGLFMLDTKLGDIRELPNGTHSLASVELQYHPGCKRPDWCPFMCVAKGLTGEMEVTEAEGGPTVYPDVVTPDFHRKIRVRVRGENVVGKLRDTDEKGPKPACFPVGYDVDMTFAVRRPDFTSQTGMCGGH